MFEDISKELNIIKNGTSDPDLATSAASLLVLLGTGPKHRAWE